MEEEQTPPVETEETQPEPSEEITSEEQEVTEVQPGTEEEPQSTFTQEQVEQLVQERVKEVQSSTDQEMERLRQHNTQLAMKQHIEQLKAQEQAAQRSDMRMVEAGNLTLQEAQQNQQGRMEDARLQLQKLQLQEEVRQLQTSVEQFARVEVARQIAEEYGVKVEDIVKEKDDVAMIKKASKLALDAERKKVKVATAKRENFSQPEVTLKGGKAPLTRASIAAMSLEEYRERSAEIDEAYQQGLL